MTVRAEANPKMWWKPDPDCLTFRQQETLVVRRTNDGNPELFSLHPNTKLKVFSTIWPWSLGEEMMEAVLGSSPEDGITYILEVTVRYRFWEADVGPWPIGYDEDGEFHYHLRDGRYISVAFEKR